MANEAAIANPPNLILMDVEMPDVDGYSVCRTLKQNDSLQDVPVIFVSGHGESMDKVKAFEAGGVDYITKPFQIDELEARIDCHLTIAQLKAELKERCAEVLQSEIHRKQLTLMIAHDLRNPLAVVDGTLNFLSQNSAEFLDDSSVELLDCAQAQSQVLNKMIGLILDIGRLEIGEVQVDCQQVSLRDIVDGALCRITTAGQILSIDLDHAPEKVSCDSDLTQRVLVNLLDNAIKSTLGGGAIEVVVATSERGVVFEVHDTGPGVSVEAHQLGVESFEQSHESDSYRASRGMGLTFCRLAVEIQGGITEVESKIDEGNIVRFVLPH